MAQAPVLTPKPDAACGRLGSANDDDSNEQRKPKKLAVCHQQKKSV